MKTRLVPLTLLGVGATGTLTALLVPLAGTWSLQGLLAFVLLPLPVFLTGAFAVWKRPDHPTARRLLAAGAFFAFSSGCEALLGTEYETHGPQSWFWTANLGDQTATLASTVAVARLFALFPDGHYRRPLERRTLRPLLLLPAAPLLLLLSAPLLILPDYLFDGPAPTLSSPFAVSWLAPLEPIARVLYGASSLVFVLGLALLVPSLPARLVRRAPPHPLAPARGRDRRDGRALAGPPSRLGPRRGPHARRALARDQRAGHPREKHVHSIFATLGLSAEPQVNRRVAAVLAFLREAGIAAGPAPRD